MKTTFLKKRNFAIACACIVTLLYTQPGGLNVAAAQEARPTVVGANLYQPMGIAVDERGRLYAASQGSSQIYWLKEKTLKPLAGKESPRDIYGEAIGGFKDGAAEQAAFRQPTAMAFWDGGLWIADTGNHAIRILKNSTVTTYAGTTKEGYRDGARAKAQFASPSGVAVAPGGILYVADTKNQVIRQIDAAGTVSTVAGIPGTAGFSDGKAREALLCDPMGLAWHQGTLYIADSGNQRIRALKDGRLTTVAGGGERRYEGTPFYEGGCVDGSAQNARFNNPCNLAVAQDGSLYIADMDNARVRVLRNGQVTTLLDGTRGALENRLAQPYGLAVGQGKLYVADNLTGQVLSVQQ